MANTLRVNGMNCQHCKNAVETAVKAIPGIKDAKVDLDKKELQYEQADAGKPVAQEVIVGVIEDLGYEPVVK